MEATVSAQTLTDPHREINGLVCCRAVTELSIQLRVMHTTIWDTAYFSGIHSII